MKVYNKTVIDWVRGQQQFCLTRKRICCPQPTASGKTYLSTDLNSAGWMIHTYKLLWMLNFLDRSNPVYPLYHSTTVQFVRSVRKVNITSTTKLTWLARDPAESQFRKYLYLTERFRVAFHFVFKRYRKFVILILIEIHQEMSMEQLLNSYLMIYTSNLLPMF